MKTDYKKIGKFIAQLRKENKMTQEALAEKLFVDRTTISKWELGENSINTETLIKISEVFDITINEMILGERISKENVESISNVTIGALRKNIKFKKYLYFTIIIILVLFVLFLSYYFINNYNSIMVYEIEGDSEEFAVHNGLLIISREKAYINIGTIENLNNNDIVSTKLYYKKDNNNIVLYENNELTGFYVSKYTNDKFQYNDLKYIISNMNLEIKFNDDNVSTIPLNFIKSYSNNNLFTKNTKPIKTEDINKFNNDIPKYIKEKFKYDNESNSYYFEETKSDKKVKHTYFIDVNVYMVDEINKDYIESYVYSYPDDITYHKSDLDGNIKEEFVYSIANKECITDSCSDEIIKYFTDEYLNKIIFE